MEGIRGKMTSIRPAYIMIDDIMENSNKEPKPCFFCQSNNTRAMFVPNFSYAVVCLDCRARGPSFEMADYCSKKHYELRLKAKAIMAWNKLTIN